MHRRKLAAVSLSLLGLCITIQTPHGADAHEGVHRPKRADRADTYRPTAVPDRIVLSWTGDPATTQAVNWRTHPDVTHAMAEIAVAEAGPKFILKTEAVEATTQPLETDLSLANYHTAEFTDLTPDTKYVYRVGDGVNWSEWSHFTTASEDAAPFSFVYFGDAQNDVKSHWSRVVREAFRDAPRAAFMLHAGDLINKAESDGEWGDWFYSSGWIHRTMPAIATPGNHEYAKHMEGEKEIRTLSKHWKPTFAFPKNGPAELAESVYYIDFQGTRIISLNSNEMHELQADWLEEVLASNDQRWTVVTMHHPAYSAAKGRDNSHIRDAWQPLFDKYSVDLVLQGHDHTYARSGLMAYGDGPDQVEENVPTGANVRSEAGTVYVVSVSGPKMYNLDREKYMRRAAEDTQLYQIISVDQDELRYRAYTAAGQEYDGFRLRKRAGKVNELIDEIPEIQENRRP